MSSRFFAGDGSRLYLEAGFLCEKLMESRIGARSFGGTMLLRGAVRLRQRDEWLGRVQCGYVSQAGDVRCLTGRRGQKTAVKSCFPRRTLRSSIRRPPRASKAFFVDLVRTPPELSMSALNGYLSEYTLPEGAVRRRRRRDLRGAGGHLRRVATRYAGAAARTFPTSQQI